MWPGAIFPRPPVYHDVYAGIDWCLWMVTTMDSELHWVSGRSVYERSIRHGDSCREWGGWVAGRPEAGEFF